MSLEMKHNCCKCPTLTAYSVLAGWSGHFTTPLRCLTNPSFAVSRERFATHTGYAPAVPTPSKRDMTTGCCRT